MLVYLNVLEEMPCDAKWQRNLIDLGYTFMCGGQGIGKAMLETMPCTC